MFVLVLVPFRESNPNKCQCESTTHTNGNSPMNTIEQSLNCLFIVQSQTYLAHIFLSFQIYTLTTILQVCSYKFHLTIFGRLASRLTRMFIARIIAPYIVIISVLLFIPIRSFTLTQLLNNTICQNLLHKISLLSPIAGQRGNTYIVSVHTLCTYNILDNS